MTSNEFGENAFTHHLLIHSVVVHANDKGIVSTNGISSETPSLPSRQFGNNRSVGGDIRWNGYQDA